jgi:CheY-like chemotaxis protein
MAARIESQPAPTPAPAAAPQGHLSGPAYLLLADDDRAEAAALAALLLKHNFPCDTVHSSEDALRAFTVRDYDMLLMNLRGPVLASLDAARAIRKLERTVPEPRVPVFMLADAISEQDRASAKDADVDDILERSGDIGTLAALVEREFEVERRTPESFIPREPLKFRHLLGLAGGSLDGAAKLAEEFAGQFERLIAETRAAIESGSVEQAVAVSVQMRDLATKFGSGRVQRVAKLMLRSAPAGSLRESGPELVQQYGEIARDVKIWLELKLGRIVLDYKAPAPSAGKRTVVKMFSFLKNRVDVFSKAS